MNVEVVSPTQQCFAGLVYTFHKATKKYRAKTKGDGNRRDPLTGRMLPGKRGGEDKVLHRDVYSSVYGNIPHGWHVHHKDENAHNNAVENLEALAPLDHARLHKTTMRTYDCIICGKDFQSSALHKKNCYCSKKCSNAYWNMIMAQRRKSNG